MAGRPAGTRNGKGHELARRWAAEFGSSPKLAREIIGEKAPFAEYAYVQTLTRVLENSGYKVHTEMYDGKAKLYSLSPADIDKIQSGEQ